MKLSQSFLLISLLFCGCSLFDNNEEPQTLAPQEYRAVAKNSDKELQYRLPSEDEGSRARLNSKENSAISPRSTFELVWQVPSEAVESYEIALGSSPTSLSDIRRIPITSLEKVDHPVYGPIYRYKVDNLDPNRTTFISLRATNRYGSSPQSQLIRVENGTSSMINSSVSDTSTPSTNLTH